MIKSLMTAVLGTRHERERKRLQPVVDRIHAEEEKLKGLSEAELKDQTRKVRERLGSGEIVFDVAEREGRVRLVAKKKPKGTT